MISNLSVLGRCWVYRQPHSSSSSSSSSSSFSKRKPQGPFQTSTASHRGIRINPPTSILLEQTPAPTSRKSHHLTSHTDILLHTDPIQQHNIPLRIKPPPFRPGHRTRRDRRRRATRKDEMIPGGLSRCPYIRVSAHEPIRMAFPSRVRRCVGAVGGCEVGKEKEDEGP